MFKFGDKVRFTLDNSIDIYDGIILEEREDSYIVAMKVGTTFHLLWPLTKNIWSID